MTNSGLVKYPGSSGSGPSPLGVVRASFDRLAAQRLPADPRPIPAAAATGNPLGSWGELRDRLRDPATLIAEIDAIWVWLIERSRADGTEAKLVCACLAEPMLAKTVSTFAPPHSARRHDIESEALAGFFSYLSQAELERPWVLHRVRWAVYRAAAAANQHESVAASVAAVGHDVGDDLAADLGRDPGLLGAQVTVPQSGHPEAVLAQAVAAGVIGEAAAELIAVSRWERRSLTSLAAERGQSVWALRKRRRRAERALLEWLTERAHDDSGTTSTVEAQAISTLAAARRAGSSPRRGRRPKPHSAPAVQASTEPGQKAAA